MSKVKNTVNNIVTGVMFGMKNTEDLILKQIGKDSNNINITQEANTNRVSHALLKGELTQEVKELRYRTYKVSREARWYEYFSPTLAKKIDKQDSKFVKYENSENLEVITIQSNHRNIMGINETFKNAEKIGDKYYFRETEKTYTINIKRNLIPRFRIEEFATRIVVFKTNIDNQIKFDLYVSIYPDDKVFISKGFVREIQKIKSDNIKSDVVEFEELSFKTLDAYKLDDMLEFVFNNITYEKIIEYDGYYVIRFKANVVKNGEDKMKEFFNQEVEDKYNKKEKKTRTLDLTETFTEKYVCENCGKEIFYSVEDIDRLAISKPRDIDEEQSESTVSEYFDIQIAEQTYGKRLCKECLEKYIQQLNEINNLK